MSRPPEHDPSAAVEEALALLDAVVAGELLAMAPRNAGDRARHVAAVRLVEIARARLAAALDMTAAGDEIDVQRCACVGKKRSGLSQ